jgi:hypothetical protein
MRNYVLLAGGFVAGIAVTCLVFLNRPPPPAAEPKVIVKEIPASPESCGPSKEILPPPVFAENLPQKLETNHEAEVRVAWSAVTGAKSYQILVTDRRGHLVKTYTTTHTAIYLKDIPTSQETETSEYRVALATVNGNNVAGEKSESRGLKVNKQASVVAPTVKNIVVED